jgi:DNA-binding SARP family transcriptional activator
MEKLDRDERLRFYLLGPPKITHHGKTLSIPRRQVRILLYLLASQNQPIPFQTLHYLFWSQQPETVCRRNLSHLFTHIRSALPQNDVLIQSSVSMGLEPDKIWSDVIEFVKLASKTCHLENLPDFTLAHQLYRGSFLDGKFMSKSPELDKYIEQKRFNLEHIYLKNLSNLISLNKNVKNYPDAIEYAQAFLLIDNYNEDILRELLILHNLMGNHGKFVQYYNRFSKQLEEDLGIKPSSKTRNLFQQISTSFSEPQITPDSADGRTDKPNLAASKYFATYVQSLENTLKSKKGSGGMAMIVGEIGMGKRDLISNYLSQYTFDQAIFRIACTPATRKIRYYPFRELAKKMISSENQGLHNPQLFSPHLSDIAAQLSKPVPIQSSVTDNHIEVVLERDFTLIRELFEELARLPVTIEIFVENIEWSDADSLEMFNYLSEKNFTQNIRFIFSFCCNKEGKIKIFEQQVELSKAHLGTVHMENLACEDVKNMLEEFFGSFNEAGRVAKQLFQLTGGNPFYISEILMWMRLNKYTGEQLASIRTFEIPNPITQKILVRFERLSIDEKKILQYAAVKDSPFRLDEITEQVKLTMPQTVETVDDLICRNLLGHDGDEYFIRYEIVHKTILSNMNSARRKIYENLLRKPIAG